MKVIHFSVDANTDIAEISLYLFDLDSGAAFRLLDRFDKTFELLAAHPMMGQLRPDFGENLRSFPVGN